MNSQQLWDEDKSSRIRFHPQQLQSLGTSRVESREPWSYLSCIRSGDQDRSSTAKTFFSHLFSFPKVAFHRPKSRHCPGLRALGTSWHILAHLGNTGTPCLFHPLPPSSAVAAVVPPSLRSRATELPSQMRWKPSHYLEAIWKAAECHRISCTVLTGLVVLEG